MLTKQLLVTALVAMGVSAVNINDSDGYLADYGNDDYDDHHHYSDDETESDADHSHSDDDHHYRPRKYHYKKPSNYDYKYGPSRNYVYAHYGLSHNRAGHKKEDHDTSESSYSSESEDFYTPLPAAPERGPAPTYTVPDLFGWDPTEDFVVHTDDEDAHEEEYYGYGSGGPGFPGYWIQDNHRGIDPWYRNVGTAGVKSGRYGPNAAYGGYYGYRSPQYGAKNAYDRAYYSPQYLADVYDNEFIYDAQGIEKPAPQQAAAPTQAAAPQ